MSAVVPLRMIVFQTLFLLIAIATEGYVLRRQLEIAPRPSIEYAASINLLTTLIGWLIFFVAEENLPEMIRIQLINYVFFNQLSSGMASWLIPAGFVTFFLSFFIKLQGLFLLQLLLDAPRAKPETAPIDRFPVLSRSAPPSTSKEAAAVLFANSLSYSAISLVLFTRFLTQ